MVLDAEEIPAWLNAVTNGAWKFHWSKHLLSRTHLAFERLDHERKFAEMRAMLASNEDEDGELIDDLAQFLRFHMKMTAEAWTWNFAE